jgi:hypothetical protein
LVGGAKKERLELRASIVARRAEQQAAAVSSTTLLAIDPAPQSESARSELPARKRREGKKEKENAAVEVDTGELGELAKKIAQAEQVTLAEAKCIALEDRLQLPDPSLLFELDEDGLSPMHRGPLKRGTIDT